MYASFFWEILLTIVIIIMEIIIIIQDDSHNRAEIWTKHNVYRNSWMMMIMKQNSQKTNVLKRYESIFTLAKVCLMYTWMAKKRDDTIHYTIHIFLKCSCNKSNVMVICLPSL